MPCRARPERWWLAEAVSCTSGKPYRACAGKGLVRGSRIVYVREVVVRGSRMGHVREVLVGEAVSCVSGRSWLEEAVWCMSGKGRGEDWRYGGCPEKEGL